MSRHRLIGVVEGFYGRPWQHELRLSYAGYLQALGLNTYLYAPKGDPWLRKRWQEDWPAEEWQALAQLAAHYHQQGMFFGVGLSPFKLYGRYGQGQRRQLRDKIRRLNELPASLLAILFDDMPGDQADLAQRQVEILADVRDWSDAGRLLVCPTYYSFDPVLERHFGRMPADYWPDLGRLLDPGVDVFWTGNRVCADAITRDDLNRAVGALGRPVMLWDNYPVNDGALRSNHLYLAPLSQRASVLDPSVVSGHLCNPMLQGRCSLPALLGLASLYVQGGGPDPDLPGQLLGVSLWRCLQRDAEEFRAVGLSGMSAQRRLALAGEYAGLPGPAACEVAGWLRGDYAFDPACLTD
tara:strand:- start:217 stop:1275 length:1059 start_codon:yes stop_codon:yes gene_type:complete